MKVEKLLAAVMCVTVLAACSGSGDAAPATKVGDERSTASDVPFKGCAEVACEGEIDGAKYRIMLPQKWNGTLLLYSHGYRPSAPMPPDFKAPNTKPEPAPGVSIGETVIADQLLKDGYALAGSAYKILGLAAVEDGVADGEALHRFFSEKVGVPNRTIVWGDSLGGLITALLAERNPEWVSGAVPLCGVIGGLRPNLDLGLDLAYGVKTLIDPSFKMVGYSSAQEASRAFSGVTSEIVKAATDTSGGGQANLVALAAMVDAQPQTEKFDGSTSESKIKALIESLLTGLGVGTVGRYDVERKYGGNVSSNEGTDYAKRFTAAEKAAIKAAGGDPEAIIGALAKGPRVTADPEALAKLEAAGIQPKGTVADKWLSIHTKADPLVIAQNEALYADFRDGAGKPSADFVQLFTVAPKTYPEAKGAPYGAGHCNFTVSTRVGVVRLMDEWIKTGAAPSAATIAKVLPRDKTGVDPTFQIGPWPDPEETTASAA